MARPSFHVEWRDFQAKTFHLQDLLVTIQEIPPGKQKLMAEIIMIRLFLLLENTFSSIAPKLLCGANYLDGTVPVRNVAPRSIAAARKEMEVFQRKRPMRYLKWTRSKYIRGNLKHTLISTDPFFSSIDKHSSILSDMCFVRNEIAHGNRGTRINFLKVVRKHYGGAWRGATPGLLLLRDSSTVRCLLEKYLIASRVIVRDLLRA